MTTAATVPTPNEFDDDNDFWPHPIYDRYEVNRNGIVRHSKHRKPLGHLNSHGYYRFSIFDNGKRKFYKSSFYL